MAATADQVQSWVRDLRAATTPGFESGSNAQAPVTGAVYEIVAKLCTELLDRLPTSFLATDVRNAIAKDGGPTQPINVVLRQEVDLLKQVLQRVSATLETARAAISGAVLMTEDVISDVQRLHENSLPASWEKGAWRAGHSGLAGWLGGLMQRCEQWRRWIEKGRPATYWLAGFRHPRSFLTAIKQEVCRARKEWTLEEVVLFTEISMLELADVKGPAEDGVYIHSLFLEGCGWHKREARLTENTSRATITPLPVLYVCAVQKKLKSYDYHVFEAPCYADRSRQGESIFTVDIRTEDTHAHKWTLRGVCVLCSKD